MHNCVNYLTRLLKAIVGDTAYDRAQSRLDGAKISTTKKSGHIYSNEFGTLEELFSDSINGIKSRLERQIESLTGHAKSQHS